MSLRLIIDNEPVGDVPHVPSDFAPLSAEHHELRTAIEDYRHDTVPMPFGGVDSRVSHAEQYDHVEPDSRAPLWQRVAVVAASFAVGVGSVLAYSNLLPIIIQAFK